MRCGTRPLVVACVLGISTLLITDAVIGQEAATVSADARPQTNVLRYSKPQGANHIELRGSFDGWQKGHDLEDSPDNATTAQIDIKTLGLAEGRYEYKFLADGNFEEGANRVLLIDAQGSVVEPTQASTGSPNEWRNAMEDARGRKDWIAMVEICQRAANEGLTDEYLLRSLSWAHRQLRQTAESWEVAQRNRQINPCTWSQIEFIDSARDHGLLDEAVKAAIALQNDSQNWGDLAKECERVITSVSSHTYEIRWRVPPPKNGKEKRGLAIPQEDPYVQRSVEASLEGLRRWSFKTSKDGMKYIEAELTPKDKDVFVTAKVTLSPHSWKPHLSKVTDQPFPPELKRYLGKGEYEGNPEAIDPTGPLARQLAAHLKGASTVETIENVMGYIRDNIPWEHVPENTVPSSEECLGAKRGSCSPRTFAATAILRAAGIPARAVRGFNLSTELGPNTPPPFAHTLLQFYLPGLGWVDADFKPPFWSPRIDYLRMSIRAGQETVVPRQPREADGFFKYTGASLQERSEM
jgi:hypothetical protein